jgi:hypothetical protein
VKISSFNALAEGDRKLDRHTYAFGYALNDAVNLARIERIGPAG